MSKPIFENFSKDKLIKKPGGAFALMPNNGATEANNNFFVLPNTHDLPPKPLII